MATLYVNAATGSDATAKASNTIGTPWATIGRAAWGNASRATPSSGEAAAAGDTVIVAAGHYDEVGTTGLGKEDPFLTPQNSGSAGNPITFQADGVVTLGAVSYSGPIIGSYQKDYIVWDGFTINEADINPAQDTGPVVLWQADNCTLKNLVITGTTVGWSDNHNGIRVEASDGPLIQNCSVSSFRDGAQTANQSGITFYTTTNAIVEKCTFTDQPNGIYVKGSNTGPITIRYNLFHALTIGIKLGGIEESGGCIVHENIVRNCDIGFSIRALTGDGLHPKHVYVVNNTVALATTGSTRPMHFQGATTVNLTAIENCIVSGNIFYGGVNCIEGDSNLNDSEFAASAGPSPSDLVIEHNVYNGQSASMSRINSNRDFATWKTFTGTDAASPASITSDPLFIDAGTNDYRLQSGSPARMAVPDLSGIYGTTRDAGARQFADNGSPIQIGYLAGADPAPTVTSCSPDTGTTAGGTSVTITGADFVATPTSVTFGGSSATSVTFVNSTTVTCVTPAHAAGAVDVVVTNPDAQTGTGTNAFSFVTPGTSIPFGVGIGEF